MSGFSHQGLADTGTSKKRTKRECCEHCTAYASGQPERAPRSRGHVRTTARRKRIAGNQHPALQARWRILVSILMRAVPGPDCCG
ncbi:hypothetical protein AX27061_1044 [Achromobacter xylosoxidans NBRC 15126 = ATCC 27061]|nr:hypothetical protein AX27061_1044 [Achromobacter xylosoxidans NBRC 15126 = ATCC 27061]CCH05090.1 hypothetical protein NH44784_011131 [Achromobacter xylosoxidans NH44784-1996]